MGIKEILDKYHIVDNGWQVWARETEGSTWYLYAAGLWKEEAIQVCEMLDKRTANWCCQMDCIELQDTTGTARGYWGRSAYRKGYIG